MFTGYGRPFACAMGIFTLPEAIAIVPEYKLSCME
jgi:hypothetical protein